MADRTDRRSGPLVSLPASGGIDAIGSGGELAAVGRALEPLTSALALLDSDLRIVLANPAFARMTSAASEEELRGRALASVPSSRWRGADLQSAVESQLYPPQGAAISIAATRPGEAPLSVRAHLLGTGRRGAAVVVMEIRSDEPSPETRDAIAEYERRIRALTLELSQVEERERRLLARDLHDGLSQALILASMRLGELRDRLGSDGGVQATVREIEGVVREAHDDLACLTFRLSPPPLRDGTLAEALRWVAGETGRRFGLEVDVALDADAVEPVDDEVRAELLRAARELLINVAKHSGVQQASVEVAARDGRVALTVADRGAGFEPSEVTEPRFGLVSIRQRAVELGGELRLESAPGRGTRATLALPRHRWGARP